MPILLGIAACAVLSSDLDQVGIDPQVDKQYAIVKQGEEQPSPGKEICLSFSDRNLCSAAAGQAGKANMAFSFSIPASDTAPFAAAGLPAQAAAGAPTIPPVIVTTKDGGTMVVPFIATRVQGPTTTITIDGKTMVVPQGERKSGSYQLARPKVLVAPRGEQAFVFGSSLQSLKGMNRKVSVKFNNASASDVLRWLSKQNVNFVANVDKLPKGKITMNVSNVPLYEALESVAESLGGGWQVKGSTLIFRTGVFAFSNFGPGNTLTIPGWKGEISPFQMDGKQFKSWTIPNREGFKFDESHMKALKDGAFLKMDEKSAAEWKKQMEEFRKSWADGNGLKMDEKSMAELKKQMEQLRNQGRPDGNGFKMDEKAMADLKKQMGMLKDNQFYNMKDLKGMDKSMWSPELWKNQSWGLKKFDVKKFMQSLTPGQKDLMKKQGYLKGTDLTDEQRGMLFDNPKELPKDFTLVFNLDGENVKIKN